MYFTSLAAPDLTNKNVTELNVPTFKQKSWWVSTNTNTEVQRRNQTNFLMIFWSCIISFENLQGGLESSGNSLQGTSLCLGSCLRLSHCLWIQQCKSWDCSNDMVQDVTEPHSGICLCSSQLPYYTTTFIFAAISLLDFIFYVYFFFQNKEFWCLW